MPRKRTTMADVAEHAGVSKTAVSLVLNNRVGTRLSEDLADRVRSVAAELGYRPNLTARSLTTQRSQIVGFVSELVTTGRFGNALIRGALHEAKRQGHVLFIAETAGEPGAALEAVDALIDRQVDGIIFAATRPEQLEVPDIPKEIPVVMLNATAGDGIPSVLSDEYEGARKIVNLLLDAGHTADLAIIGRSQEQPEDDTLTVGVRRRLDGIWASINAHGVTPIAQVPCEPWSLESGYAAVREILDAGIRPRALICLNDRIAFGAYRALNEDDLHIPDDVSIVSFDDDDIAVYLEPKLTTAAFPYEQMGEMAVRVILEGGTPQPEYLVEMPIRVRGSVKLRQ
jgi:LacI family transcriptional regulator